MNEFQFVLSTETHSESANNEQTEQKSGSEHSQKPRLNTTDRDGKILRRSSRSIRKSLAEPESDSEDEINDNVEEPQSSVESNEISLKKAKLQGQSRRGQGRGHGRGRSWGRGRGRGRATRIETKGNK